MPPPFKVAVGKAAMARQKFCNGKAPPMAKGKATPLKIHVDAVDKIAMVKRRRRSKLAARARVKDFHKNKNAAGGAFVDKLENLKEMKNVQRF